MNARARLLFAPLLCLLLLCAPTVSAQVSGIVPEAITVLGEGSASAPADFADIVITLGPDPNMIVEPLAIENSSVSVPPAVDVSAVVDAIIAQGAPVNDVRTVDPVFSGEWGPGMTAQPVTILVHVLSPSVNGISELLDVVKTTAHADGLFVNQFGVVYGVNDCRSLRQQARVDAVNQARSEAEDQAAAMETTVGSIVASRDTYPMNMVYSTANNCTSNMDLKYAGTLFDPAAPAEVQVIIAVEVSFEIP